MLRISLDKPITAMGPGKITSPTFTLSFLTFEMRETVDVSQRYHMPLTVYNYNENTNIENKPLYDPATVRRRVPVCVRTRAHAWRQAERENAHKFTRRQTPRCP